MKRFMMRPLTALLCTAGFLGVSNQALASAFQLWEQDGATVGNYHAGYAAEADNASIAWYNPAGITRFHTQQMALSGIAIVTDFKFKGTVSVTENVFTLPAIPIVGPATVTSPPFTTQGGTFNFIPNLHYVAPINDWLGFGLSIDVPFGLKTSYGNTSPARYMSTLTSIEVVDISPSLGMRLSDKTSLGVGFDIQTAKAEFDNIAAFIDPLEGLPGTLIVAADSASTNKASSTGYGFHAGLLYELTPCSRIGLSYHSQVVHHFSGSSKLEGGIPFILTDGLHGSIHSPNVRANIQLPPYTALSYFGRVNPCWALMGSIIYTQWNTFETLSFENVAGVNGLTAVTPVGPVILPTPNPALVVTLPQKYRNTWNISVGANYYATDTIMLRGGLGFDKSPVRTAYRDLRLPDTDRYALALGAHFQATRCIGFDLGWTHIFAGKVTIDNIPSTIGPEQVSANGHVTGGADVLSGQVVWNI